MRSLKWSTSHAVFVAEMDDDHREIFEALSVLQSSLASRTPESGTAQLTQALANRVADHFAHE